MTKKPRDNPAMNADKASCRRPRARSPEPRPNRRTDPTKARVAAVMTAKLSPADTAPGTLSQSHKGVPPPVKAPLPSNPHSPGNRHRRG